ncbi:MULTISPECIES: hypothetical protein [Herbaspirillum]|uniref:Uncharacterized protein n=2 Tax=Herbaspirillum huttiense TaxID=863372 RepID=A0AAJ2HBK1_9BURK|nr:MULTISPECIES: hypothetical protein [Herbaspirillum]MDR9837085.1 hypothetical protein [Herbaspirillum huttiense]
MGQAKQRGSREERIAQATNKANAEDSNAFIETIFVTHRVEGTEEAEYDLEITDKFEMQAGSARDVRSARMRVGLRNSSGVIYRDVGITGLGEFLSFVQHLQDIGLVDELAEASGPRGGYDAIFCA